MRFDKISYNLDLEENERCFYHHALSNAQRPMCFGVTDKAVFIARERFLRLEAYSMHRIPLADVKEVVLSRERGPRVWLKASIVLAFGIASMIVMAIGLWLSPNVKPGLFGTAGPVAFAIVGLIMLIDNRWRLVLTIRTQSKSWRWRPHIFDKRDEVKALREGFLAACRYAGVPTRRLDLVNESEIAAFWKWFQSHANNGIDVRAVQSRLHKLCDQLDIEINVDGHGGTRQMIVTANYAQDVFPIAEELVFTAPKIRDLSVTAFKPKQKAGRVYKFSDVEYPLDQIFFIPYTDGFSVGIEICFDAESVDHPQEFAWELCKALLGEYDAVMSVEFIQIRNLNEINDDSVLRHISELSEYIDEFHCLDLN
jgi:hypothetical protein